MPVASAIGKSSEARRGVNRRGGSRQRKDDRSLPEMINDEGPVAGLRGFILFLLSDFICFLLFLSIGLALRKIVQKSGK